MFFLLSCVTWVFYGVFSSLLLLNRGGLSAVGSGAEAEVGSVDKVVFLHVHSLGVGSLLPLLPDSPAWAGAAKPYALVVFPGG